MTAQTSPSQQTPLHALHVAAGAKMMDFAGWDMPIEYAGIRKEHEAVRTAAGLFDLSHMGEVYVRGPGALNYLQELWTNDLTKIGPGRAQYGCMCNHDGKVLDDMIIYHLNDSRPEAVSYLVVMNASNRPKIVEWMQQHLPAEGVTLDDQSMQTALIAIQGPKAEDTLRPFVDISLDAIPYYGCALGQVNGVRALVSRTGYTGEDGFELYLPWNEAAGVWQTLSALEGVEPIGLGARDTLRLESGYALYGHELSEEITPLDASLGWVTKLEGRSFIGRVALKKYKEQGVEKKLVALLMEGRSIPREGYPVHRDGRQVGTVTSGTFSPSLKKGIALASVETASPSEGGFDIEIRGRNEKALLTRLPFVRGSVRRG